MGKVIQKFNNHYCFLIFYGLLLTCSLIPYYMGGTIILSGEGNFVIDFPIHFKNYSYLWFETEGLGLPNIMHCGNGLNILLLSLLEKLTGSLVIPNFVLVFSVYFIPFLAIYLVCVELKTSPLKSFLTSYFYVANPFVLYYLTCMNQWNVFSVSVMPLFLWIILKYYHNNFNLFFIFGFVSTCFSFAYTNGPLFVIALISIVFSTFFSSYYHCKRILFFKALQKYVTVMISFLIFNSWWLLNFFYSIKNPGVFWSTSFASSWLVHTSNVVAIFAKMFLLSLHFENRPEYDFFFYWNSFIIAKFIALIPIYFFCFFILSRKQDKTIKWLSVILSSMFLIVSFFIKGGSSPFGFIYYLMFKHVPFFAIFKSPIEKFGLLYVFVFSILLLIFLNSIKGSRYNWAVTMALGIYLFFWSVPIITGNILPDYSVQPNGYVSRQYKEKAEYKQFRTSVNNDKTQYRILSLPGSGNYQVLLTSYHDKRYCGLDPVLNNTNKSFLAPQHGVFHLYYNMSSNCFCKILSLYNIGKIMVNEDIIPWFGVYEKKSISELKTIFDEYMTSEKWGSITLYHNKDNFLPRIYSSD